MIRNVTMKKTILLFAVSLGLSGAYFYANAPLYQDDFAPQFILCTLLVAGLLYAIYDLYQKTVVMRQLKGLVLLSLSVALSLLGAYLDNDPPTGSWLPDLVFGSLLIYLMIGCLLEVPSLFRRKAAR